MFRLFLALAFALLSAQSASAFSDAHTARAVTIVRDGGAACGRLETVYQFDCFRQVFRKAGDALGNRPDYADARTALKEVERTLNDTVRRNEDRNRPAIRVDGRRVKPIRPDAVPAAKKSFEAARSSAVTKLLRADGKARLHYTRIAEVVGSTKVLIRSRLRPARGMSPVLA